MADYRDAAGARHRLHAPSREAAEDLLAEKVHESRGPDAVADNPLLTLKDYVQNTWLTTHAAAVDPRTKTSYDELLRIYILPPLGGVRLRKLGRDRIRALLGSLRTSGKSANTVRLVKATLSIVLGDAAEDHVIAHNPVLGLSRKNRRRPDQVAPSEAHENIRPFTPAGLDALLATE